MKSGPFRFGKYKIIRVWSEIKTLDIDRMRKNGITIARLLVLSLVIFCGCETERILFKGPYHVRFTYESDFRKESSTELVKIEVHNVGPALEEDVIINYEISGNAREGVDYTIENERGKITIPAGEYVGYIELNLINNSNDILRSQDVVFTLLNATEDLAVGQGESAMGKTFTFTILDDCILGGTYEATQGSTTVSGVAITSPDCEVYTLSNWNIGVFNFDDEVDLTFIDNYDNTLTIPQQDEQGILVDEEGTVLIIEGTGSVDPVTDDISMTIYLVNVLDDDGNPIDIQISMQRE
jgi:hypothetical protein